MRPGDRAPQRCRRPQPIERGAVCRSHGRGKAGHAPKERTGLARFPPLAEAGTAARSHGRRAGPRQAEPTNRQRTGPLTRNWAEAWKRARPHATPKPLAMGRANGAGARLYHPTLGWPRPLEYQEHSEPQRSWGSLAASIECGLLESARAADRERRACCGIAARWVAGGGCVSRGGFAGFVRSVCETFAECARNVRGRGLHW